MRCYERVQAPGEEGDQANRLMLLRPGSGTEITFKRRRPSPIVNHPGTTEDMLKIKQLLVDLYGCRADLDDEVFLMETLEAAAERVGATIVRRVTQKFSPVGVSAILILAETHLSVHTWPEHGYAAVDIFICGEGREPEAAWEVIAESLMPETHETREITRAIGDKRS